MRRLLLLLVAVLLLPLCACAGSTAPLPRNAGSLVAFASAEGVSLYSFDTGETSELTSGKHIRGLAFSGNGKFLYYNSSSDLFCVEISTGIRALAAPDAVFCANVGSAALCISPSHGLTLYDPELNISAEVAPQPETGRITSACASPDGTRFAYTVWRTDVGRELPVGFYITIPGSSDRDEFTPDTLCGSSSALPTVLAWTPDAATVLVSCCEYGRSGNLYKVPVIDGLPVPLSSNQLFVHTDSAFAVSSDGRSLLTASLKVKNDSVETLARVELDTLKFSFLPSGYAGINGLALSGDGSMAAYSSGGTAIFIYANDKTLSVCPDEGATLVAPLFSADGAELWCVDASGRTGAFCVSSTATAGREKLFDGILPPSDDSPFSWTEMLAVYDTSGR